MDRTVHYKCVTSGPMLCYKWTLHSKRPSLMLFYWLADFPCNTNGPSLILQMDLPLHYRLSFTYITNGLPVGYNWIFHYSTNGPFHTYKWTFPNISNGPSLELQRDLAEHYKRTPTLSVDFRVGGWKDLSFGALLVATASSMFWLSNSKSGWIWCLGLMLIFSESCLLWVHQVTVNPDRLQPNLLFALAEAMLTDKVLINLELV